MFSGIIININSICVTSYIPNTKNLSYTDMVSILFSLLLIVGCLNGLGFDECQLG